MEASQEVRVDIRPFKYTIMVCENGFEWPFRDEAG